jgi:hypothetical protein
MASSQVLQVSARLPQRDGRWFCRRSYTRSFAGGAVDVFFYDTAPFVQYYYDREWANNRGAHSPLLHCGDASCCASNFTTGCGGLLPIVELALCSCFIVKTASAGGCSSEGKQTRSLWCRRTAASPH